MSYATATAGGELNWTTASSSCNVTQPVGSPTFWFYRTVVEVYIVSALCVAGVIGNLLSMIVLRRDRDRPNATNWLLQALAVVDSIYLVASVLIQPLKTINDIGDLDGPRAALRRVFPYVEPPAWAVASIAQTAAVWLVLLVTVDRYVAVCQPLQVCFIVHISDCWRIFCIEPQEKKERNRGIVLCRITGVLRTLNLSTISTSPAPCYVTCTVMGVQARAP